MSPAPGHTLQADVEAALQAGGFAAPVFGPGTAGSPLASNSRGYDISSPRPDLVTVKVYPGTGENPMPANEQAGMLETYAVLLRSSGFTLRQSEDGQSLHVTR